MIWQAFPVNVAVHSSNAKNNPVYTETCIFRSGGGGETFPGLGGET
jgi:hypothetical protein